MRKIIIRKNNELAIEAGIHGVKLPLLPDYVEEKKKGELPNNKQAEVDAFAASQFERLKRAAQEKTSDGPARPSN